MSYTVVKLEKIEGGALALWMHGVELPVESAYMVIFLYKNS